MPFTREEKEAKGKKKEKQERKKLKGNNNIKQQQTENSVYFIEKRLTGCTMCADNFTAKP